MSTIALLDQNTIDKIAAGEVVERPASVVKELIENSIDAGASAITVEIKNGGIEFVRITDNGCGIEAEQVRLAFLRHATSKLRSIGELNGIRSLGFRGEALASIAAVSRVELITRSQDSITGVRYVIEGGEEKSYEEVGAPYGTTFLMRNLFFNTPVRGKFLKSPVSEANAVAAYVEQLALSHPEISFKYMANGSTKLYTSGNGDLKEAVYQIYGREAVKSLIPFETSTDYIRFSGFLGNGQASRGNRSFEIYFVNGRYVKSRLIAKALEEAYQGHLMQHRYPFVVLNLDIDRNKVDVNVHPAKLELRFSEQEAIYRQIYEAVRQALHDHESIPAMSLERSRRPAAENFRKRTEPISPVVPEMAAEPIRPAAPEKIALPLQRESVAAATDENEPKSVAAATDKKEPETSAQAFGQKRSERAAAAAKQEGPVGAARIAELEKTLNTARTAEPEKPAPLKMKKEAPPEPFEMKRREEKQPIPELVREKQMSLFEEDRLTPQKKKQHRVIGQVFETYMLVEMDKSFYIIDQHAAHEKVLYERLMASLADHKVYSQQLFPPIVLSMTQKESAALQENRELFLSFGFEFEEFGGKEFKITAVPADLFGVDVTSLFLEILDNLGEPGAGEPKLLSERIATRACKAAIKGNMKMSNLETEKLLEELFSLDDPYHCPHGRPTMISLSHYELDRKFKRIV